LETEDSYCFLEKKDEIKNRKPSWKEYSLEKDSISDSTYVSNEGYYSSDENFEIINESSYNEEIDEKSDDEEIDVRRKNRKAPTTPRRIARYHTVNKPQILKVKKFKFGKLNQTNIQKNLYEERIKEKEERKQKEKEEEEEQLSSSEEKIEENTAETKENVLISLFRKASLNLKIVKTSKEFSRNLSEDTKSFLLDIRKIAKKSKTDLSQRYLMHLGEDSFVEVFDINTELHQLILCVKEPERQMTYKRFVTHKKTGKKIEKTATPPPPAEERRLLLGKDEGHYFISLLPKLVSTVKAAHKLLKPAIIKKSLKKDYTRQGEWFFLKMKDHDFVPWKQNRSFQNEQGGLRFNGGISNGKGRAHIVSENCIVGNVRFVKGSVTHPDHKTKFFKNWVRVFSNSEKTEKLKGVTWVD